MEEKKSSNIDEDAIVQGYWNLRQNTVPCACRSGRALISRTGMKISLDLALWRDRDRRGTLAETIMQGSGEVLPFGAAGNLNIICFAIINFAYNADTISGTLVTQSARPSNRRNRNFEVVALVLIAPRGSLQLTGCG